MAVTYCTHTDVADLLRITIDGTTLPSQAQTEKIINRMEDYLDQRTGHAWGRNITVTNETHSLPLIYVFGWGAFISLAHYNVKQISAGAGDKVEIWSGATGEYSDITTEAGTTFEEIPERGEIYFRGFIFTILRSNRVRVTYRYGDATTPLDIKDACVKLVARDLLAGSFRMDIIPTGGTVRIEDSINQWKQDIERVIRNREHVYVILD